MLGEKFDHESIKEPRLLHRTRVAGSGQYLQLAIGYALPKCEGALMAAVLAASEDDRRAVDAVLYVGVVAPQFGYARMGGRVLTHRASKEPRVRSRREMGVYLTSPKCISARHAKKHPANHALRKRKDGFRAIRAWRGLLWQYNRKSKGVDAVKGFHVRHRVDRRKHHR